MPGTQRRKLGIAAIVLIVTSTALADDNRTGWLSEFSATDLNNYSLGISLSVQQNPYAGSRDNVILYPILTSFNDPAFTSDWLIANHGDLGVRHVFDSELEIGWLARVNTLGTGSQQDTQFRGISERRWTVETGPMVGYRELPIHFKWRTYLEILGRHDGYASEFSASLPWQHERGWLIPSVTAAYQSERMTDYYYGVNEAGLDYQPGSALNYRLGLDYGLRLSSKWLMSGGISFEVLDDVIADSPLVDTDTLWSANIGLAYNADVFQSRAGRAKFPEDSTVTLRIGAFLDFIRSRLRRDAATLGVRGSEISPEDAFATGKEEVVPVVDVLFRIGDYHRLETSYFELLQTATALTSEDIQFGDTLIPAGTEVATRFQTETLIAAYGYSLLKDAQKEAGILAGLHYSRFALDLQLGDGRVDSARAEAPLPVVGAYGHARFLNNWLLMANLHLFAMDLDEYNGFMARADIRTEWQFNRTFSIGAGYTFYYANLTSDDNDLRGELLIQHQGPSVFLGFRF